MMVDSKKKETHCLSGQQAQGFTLIETLITMVIAMVIMAGLLMMFMSQSTEYSYQNKRIDAVQDAEFVISYIADDLRAALVSPMGSTDSFATMPSITSATNPQGKTYTSALTFDVWIDPYTDTGATYDNISAATERATRKYVLVVSGGAATCYSAHTIYTGKDYCLRYDREVDLVNNLRDYTNNANSEMLRGVTFFKVFRDDTDSRAGFKNIPAAIPRMNVGGYSQDRVYDPTTELSAFTANGIDVSVHNSAGTADEVSGYTILLEVAVDSSYKEGSFIDVFGTDVRTYENPPRKRIIRYAQVFPMSMVP